MRLPPSAAAPALGTTRAPTRCERERERKRPKYRHAVSAKPAGPDVLSGHIRTTRGYGGGSGYTFANTEKLSTVVDFPEVLDVVRA